jgi:hypothetical protein
MIAPGVCADGGGHQQLLQVDQRHQIDLRRTHGHAGAHHWINHPRGYRDDHTPRPLDLQEPARRSLFHPTHADLAAEVGVPSVMDFQLIADMGRMNGQRLAEEKHGCSSVPIAAASGRR